MKQGMMERFITFWWVLNLLFLICNIPVYCRWAIPRIHTKQGEVIGRYRRVPRIEEKKVVVTDVDEFLSIPYAKPPLDDLRLRRAVPIDKFPTHFVKCTRMPKACMQYKSSFYLWAVRPAGPRLYYDEDCLYLNIWVPDGACQDDRKSVFFWIHGGGFVSGSARQAIYDGRVLAAYGDIIVVTVNYRLGALGFWTNGKDEPDTRNIGLWDVITALKWVNENIEAFGGDKEKITIAGQDAGAIIVSLLSVTPYAKGLFKRQIIQSDSAMSFVMNNRGLAEPLTKAAAVAAGCANSTVNILTNAELVEQCMREDFFDLEDLYGPSAMPGFLKTETQHEWMQKSFYPTFDKNLFPKKPHDALLEGVPVKELLIGNIAKEGTFLLTTGRPEKFGFDGKHPPPTELAEYRKIYDDFWNIYKGRFGKNRTEAPLKHELLPDGLEKEDVDMRLFLAESIAAFAITCPILYYAALSRNYGAKVYYYEFNYKHFRSEKSSWMLPTHFDELRYIFGLPISNPEFFDNADRDMSKMMIRHWSNFVKFGMPDDDWPIYANNSARILYHNSRKPSVNYGPHGYYCEYLFIQIFPLQPHVLPRLKEFPDYMKTVETLREITKTGVDEK